MFIDLPEKARISPYTSFCSYISSYKPINAQTHRLEHFSNLKRFFTSPSKNGMRSICENPYCFLDVQAVAFSLLRKRMRLSNGIINFSNTLPVKVFLVSYKGSTEQRISRKNTRAVKNSCCAQKFYLTRCFLSSRVTFHIRETEDNTIGPYTLKTVVYAIQDKSFSVSFDRGIICYAIVGTRIRVERYKQKLHHYRYCSWYNRKIQR